MRRVAKVDRNQSEIVASLRKAGVKVQPLHQVGGGFPDLLCLYAGRLTLLEVKSPGGRLTPDEQAFYHEWQEATVVVYSVEEALRAIGRIL